jgi:hypothetical protein
MTGRPARVFVPGSSSPRAASTRTDRLWERTPSLCPLGCVVALPDINEILDRFHLYDECVNQALAASSPILVGKRRVSEAKQCETGAELHNLR